MFLGHFLETLIVFLNFFKEYFVYLFWESGERREKEVEKH